MSSKNALAALAASVFLIGCGGGDGGSSSAPAPVAGTPPATPPASTPPVVSPPPAAPAPPAPVTVNRPLAAFAGGYVSNFHALVTGAYDVAYDAVRDELVVVGYVLPGGGAGIAGLDPVTLAQRWSMATSGPGNAVAISHDASKLYVGVCDSFSVLQIDRATRRVERSISVGSTRQPICAGSLSVRPNHPLQVAVGLVIRGPLVEGAGGVLMYDDGRRLADHVSTPYGFNWNVTGVRFSDASEVRFADENLLIAKTNYVDAGQLHRYTVSSSGIQVAAVHDRVGTNSEYFELSAGRVFLNAGHIYELADFDRPRQLRNCRWAAGESSNTAVHASGQALVCINSVPQAQRRQMNQIELEVQLFGLDGERVERWSRLDLSAVIPVPGVATPELDIRKVVSLPNGTLLLLTRFHLDGQRTLISLAESDLAPAISPAPVAGSHQQDGLTVSWTTVPTLAQVSDDARGRLVGLTPGIYGSNGSAVVVIDKQNRSVLGTVRLSREPRGLVLSSDGVFAYVWDERGVQQVNLSTFSTGWNWRSDAGWVTSLAFQPGSGQRLAVRTADQIVLLDGAQVMARLARRADGDAALSFLSPSRLVEVTNRSATAYQVTATAVQFASEHNAELDRGVVRTWGTLAYSQGGQVFDLTRMLTSTESPSYQALTATPGSREVMGYAPLATNRSLVLRSDYPSLILEEWTADTKGATWTLVDQGADLGWSALIPVRLGSRQVGLGQYNSTNGTGATFFIEWTP